MENIIQQPIVQLVVIIVAVMIFAKIAGVFKKLTLSAGAKKYAIILSVVVLIGLNVGGSMYPLPLTTEKEATWGKLTAAQKQENVAMNNILLGAGLVTVLVFAFALMAETKEDA